MTGSFKGNKKYVLYILQNWCKLQFFFFFIFNITYNTFVFLSSAGQIKIYVFRRHYCAKMKFSIFICFAAGGFTIALSILIRVMTDVFKK